MALPTEKSKPESSLDKQVILIYGRPKIGKTTFCSQFDKALFLATEPIKLKEVYKVNINSWRLFLETCGEISQGKHDFKNIVIDTVDNLIILCQQYICEENNVDHISELPHGKGWSMVTTELTRPLIKLGALPYGIVLVSHCEQEEVETKTKKYNRFTIDIGGKNKNVVLNMANIILFMDSEYRDQQEIGVIHTKPSLYYDAGDQSKKLPENIYFPLDKPEKAYEEIVKCFNNKTGG